MNTIDNIDEKLILLALQTSTLILRATLPDLLDKKSQKNMAKDVCFAIEANEAAMTVLIKKSSNNLTPVRAMR
jgi:hypothetical protein